MDLYFYRGEINREGYSQLCRLLDPKNENCGLVLSTYGGDPDAAFRIARALRHHYPKGKLTVFIPDFCKSAGTLVAVGASELVVFDEGELGPLDVQLSKQDELIERSSGLDIMQGLNVLREETLEAFKRYMLDITFGSRQISVRTAADMATKLVTALYAPIYGQIDPIRLGQIQRAISIADHYGEKLNEYAKNLKDGALRKLILSYPSHGFVIDRKEARELFENVRAPSELEFAQINETKGIGFPYAEPSVSIINNQQGLDRHEKKPATKRQYEKKH